MLPFGLLDVAQLLSLVLHVHLPLGDLLLLLGTRLVGADAQLKSSFLCFQLVFDSRLFRAAVVTFLLRGDGVAQSSISWITGNMLATKPMFRKYE